MPKLVLLGGPTGVGKSTALKLLENQLPKSAVLDADDVWRISEDLAVEGTRGIAIANVAGVLRGYFQAGCEVAILGWVFARSALYEPVIASLADSVDTIQQLYLVASPEALRARLENREGFTAIRGFVVDNSGHAIVRTDAQEVLFELAAAAYFAIDHVVVDAHLLQLHSEFLAVGGGPVVDVYHVRLSSIGERLPLL